MFCSFMGGVSFGGRLPRPRFGLWSPEGYTAFSSFTHLLRVPRRSRTNAMHMGTWMTGLLRRSKRFRIGKEQLCVCYSEGSGNYIGTSSTAFRSLPKGAG